MENISREEKYKVINSYLNDKCLLLQQTYYYEYIPKIFYISVYARKIMDQNDISLGQNSSIFYLMNPEYGKFEEYLPYSETLQIVRKYIAEKLPKYVDKFEECLNNGIINIVDLLDDYDKQPNYNAAGYIKGQGHHYVNVVLRHNYCDPAILIHEFIHHLNDTLPEKESSPARELLTELASIYFEYDLIMDMSEKGYKQSELTKVIHARIIDTYNLCGEIQIESSLFNAFKCLGNLSDNSYDDAKQLNLIMMRPDKESYLQDIDDYYAMIKKNQCSPEIKASYLLGTVIAFANLETNSDDTRAKYTEFIEALKTKNTYDCLEIIGVNFDRKADIPNLLNNFSKYVEKVDEVFFQNDKDNTHKK